MVPFFLVLIRFLRAFWASLKDPQFQALFFLVVVTLAVGAWFYRIAEGWSLLDSFYFSVITLTTVGFGDFTPTTVWGKLFTACYIFVGVAIILTFIDAMGEISLRRRGIDPYRARRRSEDTEQ